MYLEMILWLGLLLGLPSAWAQVLILQKAFCSFSGKSLNPSSALSASFYLWLFLTLLVSWGKTVPLCVLMSLSLLVSSSIMCELVNRCCHPCSSKRETEAERHCTTGVLVFRRFCTYVPTPGSCLVSLGLNGDHSFREGF